MVAEKGVRYDGPVVLIGNGFQIACATEGCTKKARGSTDYRIAHGGGKRCAADKCNKGARGSTYYCTAHGGGTRCAADGCNKGAVGATDYCIVHGGGKRCGVDGCNKVAVGSTVFCRPHAQDAGLLPRSFHGVSQEEMEFLDDVEAAFGPLDDRVRFDGTEWVGRQQEGLVPGTRLRPDGYRARNQDGECEVWFYHGWFWHGYPPEHPDYETAKVVGGKSGPDAYMKTMADMAKFQEAGMVVKYAWCFEYKQTRGRSPKERTALTV